MKNQNYTVRFKAQGRTTHLTVKAGSEWQALLKAMRIRTRDHYQNRFRVKTARVAAIP